MSGLFQDDPPDMAPDLAPVPEGPGLFGEDALPARPRAAPASPAAAGPTAAGPTAAGPTLGDAMPGNRSLGGPAPGEPSQADPIPADPPPPVQATAYRVLARTYRPRNFDDLIGQDAMVRILRQAFALGRIAHAFMLTGVRGVGKTTTARIIARCLNCIGPDGTGGPTAEPCGVCPNCVAILGDRHPDVLEMDAASKTGIDDVREIIDATRFRPLQARTKVFIIDEVHMLSRHAFNALLKTLEEPPAHVKFIFATTELRKVPVTVLSRCQRFDLRRIAAGELAAHFARIAALEQVSIEAAALESIARAADGSVRDGLSLLDQAIAQAEGGSITALSVADMLGLADRTLVFDLMEAVMAGQPAAALAITDRAHERGADLGLLLADLLELCHTLSRLRAVPELRRSSELAELERTRGAALADRLSVPMLGRAWQMLLKGIGEVEGAPDRRAAAEMVLIRLCHVADLPPPGELVRRLAEAPPAAPGGGAPQARGAGARSDIGPAARDRPAGARRGDDGPAAERHAHATAQHPPAGQRYGDAPGARMAAGGGGMAEAAPAARPPAPAHFRDVVALAGAQREPMLHAHLLHSVHLVRFAPPVIELRPEPAAPRDLAPKLAALLLEVTGTRWTIALSAAPGEPTLAEQGRAADAARRAEAAQHPLVRAILEAFPGATMDAVRDSTVDAYGLAPPAPLGEPDMPDFAPADAVPADDEAPEEG
jgi:DNA polymerase-3 subunit gamma/tau